MGVAYNPRVVTDGLVLCLDAGNTKSYPGSGTTWSDLSGNGNNGVVNGATWNASGWFDFDGVNDKVTIDPFFTNFSAITVEWWGTADVSSANYRSSIMRTSTSAWNDGFGFYHYNGNLVWWINQWNGAQSVSTTETTFGFTHWIGTYDGSNLKLYKNGSLIQTGSSYTSPMTNPNVSLDIGNSKNAYYWDGRIGEVLIYPRALTPAQVFQNYNATKSRFQ